MPKSDRIEVEGTVVESVSPTLFRVELSNGHRLLAHASGTLRLHFTKILPGDKILLEISPYDLSRGRIVQKQS
ncbi:MAG: translation initiation factor IF-1 [Verrucomicrobium sp.]|nr:translation initiation factor IF-1 [Verrucomicrobium sp.]